MNGKQAKTLRKLFDGGHAYRDAKRVYKGRPHTARNLSGYRRQFNAECGQLAELGRTR